MVNNSNPLLFFLTNQTAALMRFRRQKKGNTGYRNSDEWVGLGAERFGFNGKELDTEGMGGGSSTYDYGFRIYNAALGKFLSVDPLSKNYPWYTPYQFAGNSPIIFIDLDGLEEFKYEIPQGNAMLEYISSSEILSEIYSRVTVPERKSIVHVGMLSREQYQGRSGWGGTTFPPDQLFEIAQFVKSYDQMLKYNEDYPDNKQSVSSLIADNYNKYKAILGAINLTPDEIINSKDPLYAIILNSDDLKGFGSSVESTVRALNSYVHELDAHLEELLNGANSDPDDVIRQHGKYFGHDKNLEKSGDEGHIKLGDIIRSGRSPAPSKYMPNSEAATNYNAIKEAVQ